MSEVKHPLDHTERELLTENGEPVMAPQHDSAKVYFKEVTVDRADFPGGEIGTRVQLFTPKGTKRNTRRENHG